MRPKSLSREGRSILGWKEWKVRFDFLERASVAGLLIFLILGSPLGIAAQSAPPQNSIPTPSTPTAGLEGQTLTYNVYWKTAPAGAATIRVERAPDSDQVRIVGEAHSSRFVSTLYRVEDRFESLVSMKSFCSLGLAKITHEGKRHRESTVHFFSEQRVARLNERNLATPAVPMKRTQTPIPGCVQDVLSALFYLRAQPLTLGKSVQFPVFDNGKLYNLTVEIQQRETIKTDAGTVQAIRVEPKVFGGLFKRPGRLYVWYSDDEERRIVQLKARIPVGTITALLATPSLSSSSVSQSQKSR